MADLNEGTRQRNLRVLAGNAALPSSNLRKEGGSVLPRGTPTDIIQALGGHIGGWTIQNGMLTADGGNIKLNSFVPSISLGSATTYSTGTGIWEGNDGGVYKWRVGNPAGHLISWDGSMLSVKGTVTATAGVIGGWTLGATSLTAGSGANRVGLDSGGVNPAIYAGSETPGSAPFRVTKSGAITAESGTIGGCALAASSISANYVAGISGFKLGSDGSAEFKNVNISGSLHATVFEKGIEAAFAGSMFCGKSAGVISTDFVIDNGVIPFANTAHLKIKAPPGGGWVFDTGDIVHIKAQHSGGVGDTWLTLTRTATTNEYDATVNNGTKNCTYAAGTGVEDYGPSGSGFFGVAADGSYGASAAWILGTHGGQPWLGVGVANGITQQVYAGANGKLYAGAGKVQLDSQGLTCTAVSGEYIFFYDGVDKVASIGETNVDLSHALYFWSLHKPGDPYDPEMHFFCGTKEDNVSSSELKVIGGKSGGAGLELLACDSGGVFSTLFSMTQADIHFFSDAITVVGGFNVGSATGAQAGQVKTSGNVFVGTGTMAGAALDGLKVGLGGNSYITLSDGTRTTFMGADVAGCIIGSLTNHDVTFRANNTAYAALTTGGAFVLNTGYLQAPTLHIGNSGTSYLSDFVFSTGANRNILLAGITGYSNGFTIQYTNSPQAMVYTMANGNLTVGGAITANADLVTSSGRIGVGVTPGTYLDVNGNNIRIRTKAPVINSTDAGSAGDIRWGDDYIYVCVAANTWKRCQIFSW